MKKLFLDWTLSHSTDKSTAPVEEIPATVPGAIQLDYAKANGYPDYNYGENFHLFDWMENEYFFYRSTLDFNTSEGEYAFLHLDGIDYRYEILIDKVCIKRGEGLFTPLILDVTEYGGSTHELTVVIHPVHKYAKARNHGTRDEAADCCRPASSYGWDWHPRLVARGLWKDAFIEIHSAAPLTLDAEYTLASDYSEAILSVGLQAVGSGVATVTLTAPDGTEVASKAVTLAPSVSLLLSVKKPLLWYPRGYGAQPIYTLSAAANGKVITRSVGFRSVRLVQNEGARKRDESGFPMSRISAPATLEVNGRRVFAKGSNWINAELFPSLMTYSRYEELLSLAEKANMNILRVWGGGYINHDCFYELCDRKGIMIWQEFMLSCNAHPDDDYYLTVLTQEATSIIKCLRTHPCISLWCGGNELFNSWSGLTDQSHPLRLLNALCYELDRHVPFNYTSPLCGMGHGAYTVLIDREHYGSNSKGLNAQSNAVDSDEEFVALVTRSNNTAYTEFGSGGGAAPEYVKRYIDEKNYLDCNDTNSVWLAHHGFRAWKNGWLRKNEMDYFFGGYESVDDLLNKSLLLQSISYKTLFEEMRKQAPLCGMALNWCFNEPWPCFGSNSLICYPAVPKPAFTAVSEALRPTIASLRVFKNSYLHGETAEHDVWLLNDSDESYDGLRITATLCFPNEAETKLGEFRVSCAPRENVSLGKITYPVTAKNGTVYSVLLTIDGHPEMDSQYTMIVR